MRAVQAILNYVKIYEYTNITAITKHTYELLYIVQRKIYVKPQMSFNCCTPHVESNTEII